MEDPLYKNTVTAEDFRRIRQVFEAALEHPREEQEEFLKRACGEDAALRREVERMLAAERASDPLLDALAPSRQHNRLRDVCPSCKTEMTVSHRFCPFCGTPLQRGLADEGRFRPGALFANRFRIVGAVGRGGMGEVYRANDLELGQAVALKFLPAVHCSERARARLRSEVRLARQISHCNVCRVYDIGEADGQLYLSMEYIEGEDLGALLRRIGRLPSDKALELGHKLCAGLAAAHAQSVLHRDLKPGNIMIDARGELRITDFGLAAAAGQIEGTEARNGTPAYMAPEQLAGREASVRSDLYALGLVLYEMYTGKPPFQANTAAELLRMREGGRITSPTALVPDLDPAVESAILRCLDPDPNMRPASGWELAASLPGGDPLRAALAAGETPSPEMVSATGSTEALQPAIAIALLVSIAAGLISLCILTPKVQMAGHLPLERSPEFLAEMAREVARNLGYTDRPANAATGIESDLDYFRYMEKKVSGGRQWKQILAAPPSPVRFWYRQSPDPLVPESFQVLRSASVKGVTPDDPGLTVPGMVSVHLDLDGRLMRFAAVPQLAEPSQSPGGSSAPPDWSAAFTAAHLDMARFSPANPESALQTAADTRAAWTGLYPGRSDLTVRVEAAASNGKVILFETIWPWRQPNHVNRNPPLSPVTLRAYPIPRFRDLFMLVIAALFAWYNWKTARTDRQGAWRVGVCFGSTMLLSFIFQVGPLQALKEGLPFVVFNGVRGMVLYLALEPWVRKQWPQVMITWSRVLAGRWRDPLVGRDMLVGLLLGIISGLAATLLNSVQIAKGAPPAGALPAPPGLFFTLTNLLGTRFVLADIANALILGLSIALLFFLTLFLLRVLLRNQWLAGGATVALTTLTIVAGLDHSVLIALFLIAIISPQAVILLRVGFFAFAVALFGQTLATSILLTTNFTAWYGQSSLAGVIVISALALWGFRTSLGNQSLIGKQLFGR